MRLDHSFYITQSQSESFHIVNIAGRYPEEFLKYTFLIFLADPNTIIPHLNADIAAFSFC